MKEHIVLKEIAVTLIAEEINYLSITNAIKEYKNLLAELSDINLEDEEARKNIQFENGKALGTTWAAMCIDDLMRTKKFISGIFKAIQFIRQKKKEPVHIVYAGTGPYAALLLPLLTLFSENEIRLSLLEINKESFSNMMQVMEKLGFSKYIHTAEQVDATLYKINDPSLIDMVVSETMQHALKDEQQVPITINLMNQLGEKAILIPQNITLKLALINSGKQTISLIDNNTGEYKKVIGNIFELNAVTSRSYVKEAGNTFDFPSLYFSVNPEELKGYDRISILTDIQVFQDEEILINESGLTMPLRIDSIAPEKQNGFSIELWYEISNKPGIRFKTTNER